MKSSIRISARSRTVLVTLFVSLALGGCGRRGNLEPPPDARVGQSPSPGLLRNQTEALEGDRMVRDITPPKDPFILDPLL